MKKNMIQLSGLCLLVSILARPLYAQDIQPLEIPQPKDPLSVLWAIKANFINQGDQSHLVIPVAGISASYDLSKNTKVVLTLDALGSAYGYVLYDSKNTRFPSFDNEAFVDEFFIDHNFNKNISAQVGKIRYVPNNGENPLPFGTSNPLILTETYFPRWAGLVDIHSADRKQYAQLFVGESEDGKSDLALKSDGLFLGAKVHLAPTDTLGLHASALVNQQDNAPDYWLSTVGIEVSNKEKSIDTFLNALFYDHSPYRLNPNSKMAVEGGLKCRPAGLNGKTEFGLVATCVDEESQQLVGYFKYKLNPTTHVMALVGYRNYDSAMNAAGLEDGPVLGLAFETIQSLWPTQKSKN